MASPIKERVYAAAATISEERAPTVTAVREAAGVSMADASHYLKEWKNEREAAIRQMIAAPPAMIEQGQRLAGVIWDEAITLAGGRHAADLQKWKDERALLSAEVAELVAAADAMEATYSQKAEQDAHALTQAQSEAAAMAAAVENAQAETATVAAENTDLRTELAAVQATAKTLQSSMDAVIAKISTPKGAGTATVPKGRNK